MLSGVLSEREAAYLDQARKLVELSRIRRPPVDPARLAASQGIKRIVLSDVIQASGQLLRRQEGLVIVLNAKEPLERRNFSCCHEIAHAFSVYDGTPKFRSAEVAGACGAGAYEEYLCDRAAAEMLLPEAFFRPRAMALTPSISALIQLARTFGASISTTMRRVGELSLWPVFFLVWHFQNRPGSCPKLRVAWSVRPSGIRCFIPKHIPADPASGMYATFCSSHPTLDVEALELGSLRGRYLVENARFGESLVSIVHDPRLQRRP